MRLSVPKLCPRGRPIQQQDYFHIRFALYKDATHPLFLEPGHHTIRAAFTFQPKEVASVQPIRVISNPVRIKVLPYEELRAILSDMFRSRRPLALTDVQLRTVYNKQPSEFTRPIEVRLKRIVMPSPEAAREAWQRALDGEDFDALISEYFVPSFASARSQPDAPGKGWVCTPWIPRSSLSTLENLPVGEISQPYHRLGDEEYFISKVVAERCLGLLPFQDVADKIYLSWCHELIYFARLKWETDVPLLTLGTSPEKYALCLNLARRLLAESEWAGAAGAALIAHRNRDPDLSAIRGKAIEGGEYPEEQILLDLGLNYVRYMRAIRRFYRLSDEEQKKMVPTLIREVERGQAVDSIAWLSQIKDPRAIPVLESCLTNDQIWVQERGGAEQTTISLVYPVRMKALWALKEFGIEKQGIKTSVGQEIIISTEPGQNAVDSESEKISKRFSQPISCRFEDAELKGVAMFFAQKTGIGVVLDETAIGEIKQKISVQIDNVPAGDALRQILQPLGLDFWQQKTIIYISVPSNLAMTAMRSIGEMPNEAERIEALKQALESGNKYLREEAKKELQNRQLHH